MQFIFTLLKKVSGGLDANKAAKEAYAETLSKHHGFMVKKTFEMGLMAAPSTDSMLPYLGNDKVSEDQRPSFPTPAARRKILTAAQAGHVG